jgi:hypothetical protein
MGSYKKFKERCTGETKLQVRPLYPYDRYTGDLLEIKTKESRVRLNRRETQELIAYIARIL